MAAVVLKQRKSAGSSRHDGHSTGKSGHTYSWRESDDRNAAWQRGAGDSGHKRRHEREAGHDPDAWYQPDGHQGGGHHDNSSRHRSDAIGSDKRRSHRESGHHAEAWRDAESRYGGGHVSTHRRVSDGTGHRRSSDDRHGGSHNPDHHRSVAGGDHQRRDGYEVEKGVDERSWRRGRERQSGGSSAVVAQHGSGTSHRRHSDGRHVSGGHTSHHRADRRGSDDRHGAAHSSGAPSHHRSGGHRRTSDDRHASTPAGGRDRRGADVYHRSSGRGGHGHATDRIAGEVGHAVDDRYQRDANHRSSGTAVHQRSGTGVGHEDKRERHRHRSRDRERQVADVGSAVVLKPQRLHATRSDGTIEHSAAARHSRREDRSRHVATISSRPLSHHGHDPCRSVSEQTELEEQSHGDRDPRQRHHRASRSHFEGHANDPNLPKRTHHRDADYYDAKRRRHSSGRDGHHDSAMGHSNHVMTISSRPLRQQESPATEFRDDGAWRDGGRGGDGHLPHGDFHPESGPHMAQAMEDQEDDDYYSDASDMSQHLIPPVVPQDSYDYQQQERVAEGPGDSDQPAAGVVGNDCPSEDSDADEADNAAKQDPYLQEDADMVTPDGQDQPRLVIAEEKREHMRRQLEAARARVQIVERPPGSSAQGASTGEKLDTPPDVAEDGRSDLSYSYTPSSASRSQSPAGLEGAPPVQAGQACQPASRSNSRSKSAGRSHSGSRSRSHSASQSFSRSSSRSVPPQASQIQGNHPPSSASQPHATAQPFPQGSPMESNQPQQRPPHGMHWLPDAPSANAPPPHAASAARPQHAPPAWDSNSRPPGAWPFPAPAESQPAPAPQWGHAPQRATAAMPYPHNHPPRAPWPPQHGPPHPEQRPPYPEPWQQTPPPHAQTGPPPGSWPRGAHGSRQPPPHPEHRPVWDPARPPPPHPFYPPQHGAYPPPHHTPYPPGYGDHSMREEDGKGKGRRKRKERGEGDPKAPHKGGTDGKGAPHAPPGVPAPPAPTPPAPAPPAPVPPAPGAPPVPHAAPAPPAPAPPAPVPTAPVNAAPESAEAGAALEPPPGFWEEKK